MESPPSLGWSDAVAEVFEGVDVWWEVNGETFDLVEGERDE